MITEEKISVFKSYKGYYDGYYIQNKDKNRLISDTEWFFLNTIMQEIHLIKKGMASNAYEMEIRKKIASNCNNSKTFDLLFELEEYLYG